MFVAYTAKIHGIIECVRIIMASFRRYLGDGWLNLRILSVQSLEAHHRVKEQKPVFSIGWARRDKHWKRHFLASVLNILCIRNRERACQHSEYTISHTHAQISEMSSGGRRRM